MSSAHAQRGASRIIYLVALARSHFEEQGLPWLLDSSGTLDTTFQSPFPSRPGTFGAGGWGDRPPGRGLDAPKAPTGGPPTRQAAAQAGQGAELRGRPATKTRDFRENETYV